MKKFIGIVLLLLFSNQSFAVTACGVVTIEQIVTGPGHGAMMRVSNAACVGNSGWVCLDPDAVHMSQEESSRLFSFVLSAHVAGKQIELIVDKNKHTLACGGTYALAHDARSF